MIERYEVTAPAGWTLLDAWPFADVLSAGTTSCSFSDTAGPSAAPASQVAGNGRRPCEPGARPGRSRSCTTEPGRAARGRPRAAARHLRRAAPFARVRRLRPARRRAPAARCRRRRGDSRARCSRRCSTRYRCRLDSRGVQRTRRTSRPSCRARRSPGWWRPSRAPEADPSLVDIATGAVRDLGGPRHRRASAGAGHGDGIRRRAPGTTGDERWQVTAGASSTAAPSAWMTAFDADGALTAQLVQPWREGGRPGGRLGTTGAATPPSRSGSSPTRAATRPGRPRTAQWPSSRSRSPASRRGDRQPALRRQRSPSARCPARRTLLVGGGVDRLRRTRPPRGR